MILLIITIVIALLISIVLPVAAGFWVNRKFDVSFRVILYGSLAYLLVQALLVILFKLFFTSLVENGTWVFSDNESIVIQIGLSVFLEAFFGVLIRWIGMKFLHEKLDTLEAAYGIGVGYGGVESILMVGLPLLSTFITMLNNMAIDPGTTNLDPSSIIQIEELWQVSALIPLAGSLERIAAFVMHLTVTILILQSFSRKNLFWLAGAFGLELVEYGLIIGLAEIGLQQGWLVLISFLMMLGNLYILYRLDAIKFLNIKREEPIKQPKEGVEENS